MSVTISQLREVTGVPSTVDVAIFLESAQTFMGQVFLGSTLNASVIDLITLYLAAHLTVLTNENGGLRRSKLGESDESYKTPGEKDTGLASTRFGQMAMMLDTSGVLAGLSANKGLKALFRVV